MKGIEIFALLSGLDDDMIESATLPEAPTATVKPPRRRWRKGTVGDLLNTGWVAACSSVVIALAVLAAIIAAGQNGEKSDGRVDHTLPPPPVTDTNGETPAPDTDREEASETDVDDNPDTDREEESEIDVDDDRVSYNLKPSTIQIINQDAPVSITSDGQTVFPKDYLLLHHITHYTELDENGKYREESTEGEGAVPLLDEILSEIPHLITTGESYTVSLPRHWDDDNLQIVRLFEVLPDGTTAEIPLPATSHPEDEFPYGFPRTPGEYVVVLHTFTVYRLDDTAREIARLEYPFRLTVLSSGSDEPKVPFPRITLKAESSQLVFATRADGYASLTPEQLPSLRDQMPVWSVCYGDTITAWRGDREEYLSAQIYTLDGKSVASSSSPESLSMLPPGQYFAILSTRKPDSPDLSTATYTYHYYPMLLTVKPIDETLLENNLQASPAAPSRAYLVVEGGGYMVEFVKEDGHFLYAFDDGMFSDGSGASGAMIRNWEELTVLTVEEGAELTATVQSVYETEYSFRLFDVNGQGIYSTTIPQLSEGVYFIIILVYTEYEYIPEYDRHEYSGYEFPFILKVVSPD